MYFQGPCDSIRPTVPMGCSRSPEVVPILEIRMSMKTRARSLLPIDRLTGLWKPAAQFLLTITVLVQGWNPAVAAEHKSEGLPDLDRRVERLQTGNRTAAARPDRLRAETILRA